MTNLDAVVRDYARLVTSCSKPFVHRHPEWQEDIEQEACSVSSWRPAAPQR